MELISLLNEKKWDESEGFSRDAIQRAMKKNVTDNMQKLYRNYYRGLIMNLIFVAVFLVVYLYNPSIEFLIPVLLITGCFLYIFINLSYQLITEKKVDQTKDLKQAITEMLQIDKKIYSRQCRYNSLILTISFTGGFLLGLAYQGWSLEKYQQKPIIFPILILLTIGFYFLTKTSSFQQLNRLLNPGYHKAKTYLEKQLSFIEESEK